jgi:hypothetical protein
MLISRSPEATIFPLLLKLGIGVPAYGVLSPRRSWRSPGCLAKGSTIVPVIGARTRSQLAESLGALEVTLTSAELRRIEETIPPSAVAGTRYDEHQMRVLDSELERSVRRLLLRHLEAPYDRI